MLKGQRATQSDVDKVPGAKGVGENPPVVTKEAGTKTTPAGRATGGKGGGTGGTGYDGVQGSRGGTRT